MKLAAVRHGETIENASDIVMGHHGGSISKRGMEQSENTAEKLKNENFDQVWSSDLKRCIDTARIILEYHPQIVLQTTPALREVNYGEFQGRPAAEIRTFFEKDGGFDKCSKVPGGESHAEMSRRVLEFINNLLQEAPDQRVLIVSHNGPIEAIREAIEKTPFSGDSLNAGIQMFEINEPLKI